MTSGEGANPMIGAAGVAVIDPGVRAVPLSRSVLALTPAIVQAGLPLIWRTMPYTNPSAIQEPLSVRARVLAVAAKVPDVSMGGARPGPGPPPPVTMVLLPPSRTGFGWIGSYTATVPPAAGSVPLTVRMSLVAP